MKKKLLVFILYLLISSSGLFAQEEQIAKIDTASGAMVVAAHPYAARIGIEILKQGGNAVDAAVATAFVIGVVEPHASGLGGGGGMTIYLKEKDQFHYLDYYMQSSENADTAFDSKTELFTPRSICIPGTPAGLITANKKYGRLPLKQVMAPAIKIAQEGFPISEKFYTNILDRLEVITLYKQTQNIFFIDDFPISEGEILRNPQLALILGHLANEGEDYFYHGEFAKTAVKDIRENGGYLTENDFAKYKAVEREPVSIDYRDFKIYSSAPPQSGITLLEILNIFENAPLANLHNFTDDAHSIHFLCEAIKRADADRYHFIGDPATVKVPIHGLLNEEYAITRFRDIESEKLKYLDNYDIPPGNPWEFENQDKIKTKGQDIPDGPHTTHISVIDEDGNAVSLTQTLGLFFGSGFSSQGVLFNSGMSVFYHKPSPNHIAPRVRPLTTISPTIVTKNGNIVLILGTPGGGRIFNVLAQTIVRLLDFDYSAQKAMEAPRFSVRVQSKTLSLENRFAPEVLTDLEKMGYKLKLYEDYDAFFGGIQLIKFDKTIGKYIGVSDPRRDGGAQGYDK